MHELAAWVHTRVLQMRIALLLVLVAGAALAADARGPWPWVLAASAALVLACRLWDDLMDLPHDRLHAPQRALVRSGRLGPFRAALGASLALIVGAFAWQQGWLRAIACLLLLGALAAVYRFTVSTGAHRARRAALVLLKYPAFVLLLARAPFAPRALAAAALLYALLLWHERRDATTGTAP